MGAPVELDPSKLTVSPTLGSSGETVKFGGLQLLVLFTLVGMLAGAYVIWDLGRIIARMGAVMASETAMSGFERRRDEVGTLMASFNKMLLTIEQQAAEINTFATRLDAAYKELESTNARLKETSFKDEVTGLYNRRFFSLRLEEELSRYRRFNHPVSVVLLDLDGFKAVNDEFGHTVGDETLREVAQILMKHSRGINVVRQVPGRGFVVWSARTTTVDRDYLYVNVRRLLLYIERSIGAGLQWAVFEPNGPALWANLVRTIQDFLLNLWQTGALAGTKPETAFFVHCDRTTMTQADLDSGRFIAIVGVAPLRAAEFVVLRITGQTEQLPD